MARAPEVSISICTWEQGLIDMVPEERLSNELGSALATLLQGFINNYRNAQGQAGAQPASHPGLQFN